MHTYIIALRRKMTVI